MGRKAYIADVAAAAALSIPGITSVVKGSEDGDIHVCYTPATGLPIEISLLSLGKLFGHNFTALAVQFPQLCSVTYLITERHF
jgi:hypothetical protein